MTPVERLRFQRALALAAVLLAFSSLQAAAELPATPTLLAELGFTPGDIADIEAGKLVHQALPASSERELTAGLAFQVAVTPAQFVAQAKQNLLDRVDPNVSAFGVVPAPGSAADFAKLTLPAAQAKAYLGAKAGGDLNLSAEEIAAFQKLGSGASTQAVEAQVRGALLARVQAYRARGLAGIAPYARDGELRSPADELRTASLASKELEKYVPAAYKLLQSYPDAKPPGTEEIVRWTSLQAHGVPTLALTHVMLVPDGDAWIAVQRQFYVSTGYNAEQAVVAFLPSKGGTVVVYGNRTSTDQVTGFGGGAKRSIGSKVLASQLESLFEKARTAVR